MRDAFEAAFKQLDREMKRNPIAGRLRAHRPVTMADKRKRAERREGREKLRTIVRNGADGEE